MASNHVAPGNRHTTLSTGAVAAGVIVIIGSLIGVSTNATTGAGQDLVLDTSGSIWEFTKNGPDNATEGADAYWDAGNSRMTTTASGNTKVGVFAAAAGAGVTTCRVRVNDTF